MQFTAWDFLISLEGFSSSPYPDSKKIPTIGIGTTHYPNGKAVQLSDQPITKQQAIDLVKSYMDTVQVWINHHCQWNYNQNQYNAICSFLYNIGLDVQYKDPNTYKALCDGIGIPQAMMSVNDHGLLIGRRQKECALFIQ